MIEFTEEQQALLKQSAINLQKTLNDLNNNTAKEFLNGDLGNILNAAINETPKVAYEDIPHFDLMTRDYLPEAEEDYFNFYSFARFGKPAYTD